MRAGSTGLSLLAVPLNVAILQELDQRPQTLASLRRSAGSPAAAEIQRHLHDLVAASVVEPRGRDRISRGLSFGLTPSGRGLLDVGAVLERWLAGDAELGEPLGSTAASEVVGCLTDAWSADIVRVLAAGPISPAELGRVVRGLSSAAIEQQLGTMQQMGLVELGTGGGKPRRYQPTQCLRHAIAPLAAAAHWERLHAAGRASPISRLEVESAFLLATPLVRLPETLHGTCRLVVEVRSGGDGKQAGVLACVGGGRVTSCVTRMQGQAESWISGHPSAWLRAVIEGKPGNLTAGGTGEIAAAVVGGLHVALFGQRDGQPG